MKNRTIAILFLSLILQVSLFAQTSDPKAPIRVTFLHVNDVYQFMPVDGGKTGGLGRLLTLRKQAIAENPNTLFTMGGDTLSPSVETLTYKGKQMIDAWNAVGLDYAAFGNHEFDIKMPQLLERIKESKFTWLGANIVEAKTGKIFAGTPEFVIREFDGAKIGIFGLILPETKQTSSMDDSLNVTDYCLTANMIVSRLRMVEKVDAVVALTHLSMAQDKALAKCGDIDLILGGHEHSLLQSASNGTPILKMTADAREMGKITLNFNRKSKRLENMDWEILAVNETVKAAPEFAASVSKYQGLLEKLAEPIGRTSVVLNAGSRDNRTEETNVGNFIADAFRKSLGADIGFLNGGSIRADNSYNPGMLTKRAVLSMLPFNNDVLKVEITGKTLKEVLEHGVARSAEDPEPGRFPQVGGMSFKFDASRPAGSRITEVLVAGMPVDDAKTYTLATSSFLILNGGDGYKMFAEGKVLTDKATAKKDAAIVEEAIKNSPNSTISPRVEGRIARMN